MRGDKKILIIAGPNGAGKTTFAKEYLSAGQEYLVFLNADLLTAGLSPLQPAITAFRAGRMLLNEMRSYARANRNFAFETTLAGRGYLRMITRWRSDNYKVKLLFLRLATPEAAIERVKSRVAQGGHDIPEAVIRRRFAAGWRNFRHSYRHQVDYWQQYNASGPEPIFEADGGLNYE